MNVEITFVFTDPVWSLLHTIGNIYGIWGDLLLLAVEVLQKCLKPSFTKAEAHCFSLLLLRDVLYPGAEKLKRYFPPFFFFLVKFYAKF